MRQRRLAVLQEAEIEETSECRRNIPERINCACSIRIQKNGLGSRMAYKYLADAWKRPEASYIKETMQERAISWRKDSTMVRIERPTRLDRARRLGYKAKKGYVIVRVRVRRSGFRKPRPRSGRRHKRMGVRKIKLAMSMKLISEQRAARRFPNLEVLNSYWVWEDGMYKWFEVIMVDRTLMPEMELGKGRGRAFRGLTSSGRKVRGLLS